MWRYNSVEYAPHHTRACYGAPLLADPGVVTGEFEMKESLEAK